MADYIEREALKNQIAKNKLMAREPAAKRILAMIDDTPAADVEPVVHGRWKPKQEMIRTIGAKNYTCSVCGAEAECGRYCPNCGAKMDEEANDDKARP